VGLAVQRLMDDVKPIGSDLDEGDVPGWE